MVARSGSGEGLFGHDDSGRRVEYATVKFPHADREKPLYMIGVAAELVGVHPQTLRTYEQKGLVTPKRTSGGTRMYSLADLDRLALIGELTEEGINLAGVTRILDLQSRLDKAEEELEDLHARVRRLASRLQDLQKNEIGAMIRATSQERSIIVRKVRHQ